MTIGEIPGFKSKRLRTKNRLPENLVAPNFSIDREDACDLRINGFV
jgi:hypothetical protein